MADKENSVSIIYEDTDERPTIAASGAFGGPAPDGANVIAHLYLDFPTLPALEEIAVQEGGIVDFSKGNQIKRGDLTRKVLATLVLSPLAAVQIGTWLMANGTQLQNAGKTREK